MALEITKASLGTTKGGEHSVPLNHIVIVVRLPTCPYVLANSLTLQHVNSDERGRGARFIGALWADGGGVGYHKGLSVNATLDSWTRQLGSAVGAIDYVRGSGN